jgi:hypothetical protein
MLKRFFHALRHRWRRLETAPIRRRLGEQVRLLDTRGFVIVSNNCIAGQLYDFGGIRKASPTAGLFFRGHAFPQFLKDLSNGDDRCWSDIAADRLTIDQARQCPVLELGPDAGITFLHYRDAELAAGKWNNRYPRMAGRTKVVIASLRDGIDERMLAEAKACFAHFHVVGPAPAPPADQFVLDRRRLEHLATFFDRVLDRNA